MNTKTIFNSNIGKLLLIGSIILYIFSALYNEIFIIQEINTGVFRFKNPELFNYPIIAVSLGSAIIAFCGIYWASLSKKHKLFEGKKSTLLLLFLVGLGLWPNMLIQLDLLLATAIILMQVGFFLTIYNQKNINKIVFNGALYLGLATLIYLPTIYFFIVFIVGVSIIRPFKLKTYLIALLGLILPMLYTYSKAYVFDYNLTTMSENIDTLFSYNSYWQGLNYWKLSFIVLFLIGFFFNLVRKAKLTVHVSNQISYLSFLFVVAFILLFMRGDRVLAVLLIPASLFVGNFYYYFNKKWILEIGLLLFLIAFSVVKWIV